MKKLPLLLVPVLALSAYAHGLTVQSPLSVVQKTNLNLLNLVYSLQPITEVPPPTAQDFIDVPEDAWFRTAADFVLDRQIMAGAGEDIFSPLLPLTRGMLAIVITSASGAVVGESDTLFTDVSGQWYEDAVNWCANHGILNGYPDGDFRGNNPVLREEMAIILYQYANYTEKTIPIPKLSTLTPYTDQEEISSYARTAMAWCVAQDLFYLEDDTLAPKDQATRADVAYAIMQLEGLLF